MTRGPTPRLQSKSFAEPDEARTFPQGSAQIVALDEATVGLARWEPGWRWSTHLAPIAGTPTCQVHHLGYAISGRLHVVMDDGQDDRDPTRLGVRDPVRPRRQRRRRRGVRHARVDQCSRCRDRLGREFIAANEPRLIAFNEYVNEAGDEVTVSRSTATLRRWRRTGGSSASRRPIAARPLHIPPLARALTLTAVSRHVQVASSTLTGK